MNFFTFFPHSIISIMPVFDSLQIVDKLFQDSYVSFITHDKNTFLMQVANPEQQSTNSIILLITPFFTNFITRKRTVSCMNVTERMLRMRLFNHPVNLVFVLFENVKQRSQCFGHCFNLFPGFKAECCINIITNPSLIITSAYRLGSCK